VKAESGMVEIIDTFPAFLEYWEDAEHLTPEQQIESWARQYLWPWPELLAIQAEDYNSQGLDWRQVAREKVFPNLAERLPAMRAAHANLLEICGPVAAGARQALGFENALTFVMHVGIGCGAGWATRFRGSAAVLFGLENIAECGWNAPATLTGLCAHEIGHLAQQAWRAEAGEPTSSGPWWQLYEEGFAQECESLICDSEIPHQARSGSAQDWLEWCRTNTGRLAVEFLRAVDSGEPVTRFFGSWFDIDGYSETGYFLGQAVIRELKKQKGLREIAMLDNVEMVARPVLEKMVLQIL